MRARYVAVIGAGVVLPERELLISLAWGAAPVSCFQDRESLDDCSFLDLKVNKWEVNADWSRGQYEEPFIRIEILRGAALAEYMHNEVPSLPVSDIGEAVLVFELDEGGSKLDEVLLLRLVSVFFEGNKLYRWCDGFREISEEEVASLPTRQSLLERLVACE